MQRARRFTQWALVIVILLFMGLVWRVSSVESAWPSSVSASRPSPASGEMLGGDEAQPLGETASIAPALSATATLAAATAQRLDASPASSSERRPRAQPLQPHTELETASDGAGIAVEGDTPFQRRLSAGLGIRLLHAELDQVLRRAPGSTLELLLRDPSGAALGALRAGALQELSSAVEPLAASLVELGQHVLYVEPHRRFLLRSLGRIVQAGERPDAEAPGSHERRLIAIVARLLQQLLDPAADLDSLQLTTTWPAADRLGRGALLRCWTSAATAEADALTPGELDAGEGMLRHLFGVTGRSLEAGIDVLATPDLGLEVFPRELQRSRALGLYHVLDEFCCLRSGISLPFRERVLRHELIHAFLDQAYTDFSQWPFVHEGLAEYLGRLGPADVGVHVPTERLRDNFAALEALLGRLRERVAIEGTDPGRLLRLPPRRFYALGGLGYRLAEATMARLGSTVIGQALDQASDAPILAAAGGLTWSDLMAFVAEHAAGGDPARSVPIDEARDATGSGDDDVPSRREEPDPVAALAEVNAPLRPGATLDVGLLNAVQRERSDSEALRALQEELRRSDSPTVFLTELTTAMDEPLAADGRSRLDFVRSLLAQARESWLRQAPIVEGLTPRPVDVEQALRRGGRFPFSVVEAPRRLKQPELRHANLIFCVGSQDAVLRERARRQGGQTDQQPTSHQYSRAYWQLFRDAEIRPRTALVMDLGGSDSDARALASALAALQLPGMLTVYWKPAGTS